MPKLRQNLLVASLLFAMVGCSLLRSSGPAPVEILYHRALKKNQYRVQKGDNLYSIAWVYEVSFQDLADLNHLEPPYALKPGEVLNLRVSAHHAASNHRSTIPAVYRGVQHPGKHQHVKTKTRLAQHHTAAPACYHMPIKHGKVALASYPYHGLFVSSRQKVSIKAAFTGRIVYSGHGIKGYGNMVLLESLNHHYVMAYAFNQRNLVHAGQLIKIGQPLAVMGQLPSKLLGVYIELRRYGRPVQAKKLKRLLATTCHR